jgi:hypothetical protein
MTRAAGAIERGDVKLVDHSSFERRGENFVDCQA